MERQGFAKRQRDGKIELVCDEEAERIFEAMAKGAGASAADIDAGGH